MPEKVYKESLWKPILVLPHLGRGDSSKRVNQKLQQLRVSREVFVREFDVAIMICRPVITPGRTQALVKGIDDGVLQSGYGPHLCEKVHLCEYQAFGVA